MIDSAAEVAADKLKMVSDKLVDMGVGRAADMLKDKKDDMVDNIKQKTSDAIDATKDKAKDLVGSAKDKGDQVMGKISNATEEGKKVVNEKMEDAKDYGNNIKDAVTNKENSKTIRHGEDEEEESMGDE